MQTTSPTPLLPMQTVVPAPAAAVVHPSKIVTTPLGTLNITLAPAPIPVTPLLETPAVWVGGATLLGVGATIIFGWRKMKKELAFTAEQSTIERNQSREQASLDRQYQSEQAHQERITKARREVYLEVISEMVKAQTALAQLPAEDIEKLDIVSSFNGLITAVSKVSILGEMETVIMSRDLLTVIHQSLFKMLARLNPIHLIKLEAKYNENKTAIHQAAIDRLIAEIETILETSKDADELSRLQNTLQSRHTDMEKYDKATLEAKLELISMNRAYGEDVLAETLAIRLKVDELVASIRTELSLRTSLEQLHTATEKMHDLSLEALKELQATLENDRNANSST